jgi:prolyl-tRNA editing enzyme YbaK/EbsC (Cys-tRNA(Pro) deacylase)
MNPLSAAAQRVQAALQAEAMSLEVLELAASTRTAQEAAQAVGGQVGQIVKSLIFRGQQTQKPYLLLVSGANQVNLERLTAALGEPLEKPNADYVRQVTGFAIGGVPPVAHTTPLEALIDPDLLDQPLLYAAAGTPNALFALTPQQLQRLTRGRVLPMA